ncbi:MAG: DUF4362 domain-containing protein [Nitrosopumilus sp.]|uniref:DUF4362 domain-containing protein n=1 Tax=Nitrosopumilus sp. TaxID=2024843 RepID=UPI00247CDECF|nr:DUF4362 domain-containing protein [Nitrosopumilus sp.]MCV0391952.1 DUF4362 domain-containing protein [Nitrosopumilus sp.]
MKTKYSIPIICIAVFVASSIIITAYTYPELFGLTKPYSEIGEYDGMISEIELMISAQCSNKTKFSDYPFAKTSNGYYYIDNVICERINVEQGGCLDPFSKGYPDETCKNRVTFDYPYGETGPEISKEFCNHVNYESPIFTNTEKNKRLYDEYLHICTIRGLIDDTPLHDISQIMNYQGKNCNTYRFGSVDCFANSFDKCVPAKIENTHFTVEGDPITIIAMIHTDSCSIDVFHDSTQDKFGKQEITKYSCPEIKLDENYLHLVSCTSEYDEWEYGFSIRK